MAKKTANQRAKKADGAGTPPEMPFFLIPGDLAQAILNYLVQQPYGAVAVLIDGMRQLQQAQVQSPPEATDA